MECQYRNCTKGENKKKKVFKDRSNKKYCSKACRSCENGYKIRYKEYDINKGN